jgi:hypothetical protein
MLFEKKIDIKYSIQGFLLTDGTFEDRFESGKIALRSGQAKKLSHPPDLYSEDLW